MTASDAIAARDMTQHQTAAGRPRSFEATAQGRAPASQPELSAFIADRAQDFDPAALLPRGTRVHLPMFDSMDDMPLDLEALAADRRLLLVFHPGGWSEAAVGALGRFDAARPAFAAAGTVVAALSPERPQFARATATDRDLGLVLATDHACRFTRSLGLAFKLPVLLRRTVRDRGLRINIWNGEGSFDLPMPVVLLLDRERRVRWIDSTVSYRDLDPARALRALSYLGAD